VFKKLLLSVCLSLSIGPALADFIWVGKGVSAVLYEDEQCSEYMLDMVDGLLPVDIAQWNKATVLFEGRVIDACWVPFEGNAAIVDHEGHGGMIKASEAKKVKIT